MELTPEEETKQKHRNVALAVALAAFVALIYVVTIVKLGADVFNRPL